MLAGNVRAAAPGGTAVWNIVGLALVGLIVAEVLVRLPAYGTVWLGHDYRLYIDAARGWLETGVFYPAYQLAGPYPIVEREILYPPVVLWLLVPFTVIPAVLWWAVPLGIIAKVVWDQKPSPVQWVLILALLAFPIEDATSWAIEYIGNGNPGIWAA